MPISINNAMFKWFGTIFSLGVPVRFETSDNKHMFYNVCKLLITTQTRKTAFFTVFRFVSAAKKFS